MDFFLTNNLNRQDFLAWLFEWPGSDKWTGECLGYPSLRFDLNSQTLIIQFQLLDSLESCKYYILNDFKFSISQHRFVLTLELNDAPVDLAVSFKDGEKCARFRALLIHYIQISELSR